MSNQGNFALVLFGVIAFVVVLIMLYYLLRKSYSSITGFSLSLIVSGAIGNLIDRVLYHRVTDFIQIYYKSFYWPTFNIADSLITVGVIVLILEGIFCRNHEKDNHR